MSPCFLKQLLTGQHCCSCTCLYWQVFPAFNVIKSQKFIEKSINPLSIIFGIYSKSLFWIWNEWLVYIANPVDLWLTVWILWKPIELNSLIIRDEKQFCLIWIWKIIKTLLYGLNNLVEVSVHNSCRTNINTKAK